MRSCLNGKNLVDFRIGEFNDNGTSRDHIQTSNSSHIEAVHTNSTVKDSYNFQCHNTTNNYIIQLGDSILPSSDGTTSFKVDNVTYSIKRSSDSSNQNQRETQFVNPSLDYGLSSLHYSDNQSDPAQGHRANRSIDLSQSQVPGNSECDVQMSSNIISSPRNPFSPNNARSRAPFNRTDLQMVRSLYFVSFHTTATLQNRICTLIPLHFDCSPVQTDDWNHVQSQMAFNNAPDTITNHNDGDAVYTALLKLEADRLHYFGPESNEAVRMDHDHDNRVHVHFVVLSLTLSVSDSDCF